MNSGEKGMKKHSLRLLLLLITITTSCTLSHRKRIDVISGKQQIELNSLVAPLAASDSLNIFNEETKKKDGIILGEILYLRIYNARALPADDNQAENLALRICVKIKPFIPNGNKYTLWKVQFATATKNNSLQLQKIFNFIPEELEEKPIPAE